MIELIYNLLFPKWQLKEAVRGEWELTNWHGEVIQNEFAVYEIYYSPTRKEYKLKCLGHNPKLHSMYPKIVEHLNKLRDEQ